MEANLVHGEGDVQGQPYRLTGHQLRVLYRLHEYDPETGRRIHRRALIGWPKGNAKTEFVAGFALEHLAGPTAPPSPNVPMGAVSEDQAVDLLLGSARQMIRDQPLEDLLEVQQRRILRLDGPGRMYSVSAAGGSNDGVRPTLFIPDELHEWDEHGPAGWRRHTIISNSLRKRRDSLELNISTAGWNLESLLGHLYTHGLRVAAGEYDDPSFLFEWWEASSDWDLDDPEQLVAAIREANPVADLFWPASELVQRYEQLKLAGRLHEFIRYHLNRWVQVVDGWMDMPAWRARQVARGRPPERTKVVLGFDGSVSGDATALVGATVSAEPHVWLEGLWERPERSVEWRVPVGDVVAAIERACEVWDVVELAADRSKWIGELERLADRGVPVVDFPQSARAMVPACHRTYEAVTRGLLTHDGSPALSRHVGNCRRRETEYGVRIVKEYDHSPRRIDAAVATVEAVDRATWHAAQPPPKKYRAGGF